ncbi:MAG: UDP-N-acetylglucosamine diphosphorylase/glucosamine-1-phosphate N-acetyltransferase [Legionellales bacterium]|nr:UDP-N-acetylglucosamine diphosphorylase/glucosamine-1-phosphate N-acetyltransferase [Legionellales bacterium]
MELKAVILAAGQGKRMQSTLPKVLHPVGGQPMLTHVLRAATDLQTAAQLVVHAPNVSEQLKQAPLAESVEWVAQPTPQGTGHALLCAIEQLHDDCRILVLYGDVPLVETTVLKELVSKTPLDAVGLLTTQVLDPTGLGRIVRDDKGAVVRIVEHKDATDQERQIKEINTGIFCLNAKDCRRWLPKLACNNAQNEYYLTDIVALAQAEGTPVFGLAVEDNLQFQGVNDRWQWSQVERLYQQRGARKLIESGVWVADSERLTIRGNVSVAPGASLDVGVVLEGDISIEAGAIIGPYVHLKNVSVGTKAEIRSHSVLEEAQVASRATVGPFARLRPGAVIAEEALVGNFVEVKKAIVGKGSKVSHLSYVGDATIGQMANIGAGTIFCNYDGANKYHTTVEDNAFVGSGSELVAPVTIGAGATVGAGTTVTKDVPSKTLCIRRAKQQNIDGWTRPTKNKETT